MIVLKFNDCDETLINNHITFHHKEAGAIFSHIIVTTYVRLSIGRPSCSTRKGYCSTI